MIGMLVIVFRQYAVACGQCITGLREVFFTRGSVILTRAVMAVLAAVATVATVAATLLEARFALLVIVAAVIL